MKLVAIVVAFVICIMIMIGFLFKDDPESGSYDSSSSYESDSLPAIDQTYIEATSPSDETEVTDDKEQIIEEKTVSDDESFKDNYAYELESSIGDLIGDTTNTGTERIVDIKINENLGTDEPEDYVALLYLNGDDNLTADYIKKKMFIDSKQVFKEIFTNSKISEATLFWKFPLSDTSGNEDDTNVLKINISKQTANGIDWSVFDYNNFPSIADSYYEHPAFNQ